MYPDEVDAAHLKHIVHDVAKQELLPRFTRVTHTHKADGSIVTEADLAAQERISEQLLQVWPGTVLLGEEMSSEQQAALLASDKPVWCLDPLDGTSNFAAGIPYFALSLSLIFQEELVLGLVYDPIRNECFFARKDRGDQLSVYLNDDPLTLPNTDVVLSKATAIIDFKRLTNDLAARLVTDRPYASQRNFGASALDWCWLAAGRGHVYLHGNQNLWDYSAGSLIFQAAGGRAVTLEGEPVYRKSLQKRSVVAGISKQLFTDWTRWIGVPLNQT